MDKYGERLRGLERRLGRGMIGCKYNERGFGIGSVGGVSEWLFLEHVHACMRIDVWMNT